MRPTLIFAAIALAGGAYLLSSTGIYGVTLFAIIPTLGGMLGAAVYRARTRTQAAVAGLSACVVATSAFLLLGLEGIICILMTLPSSLLFGSLGGLLYLRMVTGATAKMRAGLLVLPLSMGYDTAAQPPVYEVTSIIEINAPAERVWRNIVSFPGLAEPEEWHFKTGIAYPTGTRLNGTGIGRPVIATSQPAQSSKPSPPGNPDAGSSSTSLRLPHQWSNGDCTAT